MLIAGENAANFGEAGRQRDARKGQQQAEDAGDHRVVAAQPAHCDRWDASQPPDRTHRRRRPNARAPPPMPKATRSKLHAQQVSATMPAPTR